MHSWERQEQLQIDLTSVQCCCCLYNSLWQDYKSLKGFAGQWMHHTAKTEWAVSCWQGWCSMFLLTVNNLTFHWCFQWCAFPAVEEVHHHSRSWIQGNKVLCCCLVLFVLLLVTWQTFPTNYKTFTQNAVENGISQLSLNPKPVSTVYNVSIKHTISAVVSTMIVSVTFTVPHWVFSTTCYMCSLI